MAQRGRPKKSKETTVTDDAKLLKQFEQEQKIQLEALYKDLALIKKNVDRALTHVGFMDDSASLSESSFRAGRAYGPLDEANDKLEEVLNNIYDNHDFEDWNDIYN